MNQTLKKFAMVFVMALAMVIGLAAPAFAVTAGDLEACAPWGHPYPPYPPCPPFYPPFPPCPDPEPEPVDDGTMFVEPDPFEGIKEGQEYVFVTFIDGKPYVIKFTTDDNGNPIVALEPIDVFDNDGRFVVIYDPSQIWNAQPGTGGNPYDLVNEGGDTTFFDCITDKGIVPSAVYFDDHGHFVVVDADGNPFFLAINDDGLFYLTPIEDDATVFTPFIKCPEPAPEIFTVTFLDKDGNPISTEKYPDGTPADKINVPEDQPDYTEGDNYYKFIGWTDGTNTYAPGELPDVTGNVEYRPVYECTPIIKPAWKRLFGHDRYDTMAAIAEEGFETSDDALLCTGTNFPDALVASSLAGYLDCPVILTKPTTLSEKAAEQLERLGVKHVYVLGGDAAVAPEVEEAVRNMGIETERIAGKNRQATSVEAFNLLQADGEFDGTLVIATGKKSKPEKYFADALSIGPWCYKTTTPVLLTTNDGILTEDEVAVAKAAGVTNLIIVGGDGVVSDEVIDQLGLTTDDVIRLGGKTRYETTLAIAEWELAQGMTMTNVAVSTGAKFPDALAGAALCGKNNSVILLAQDQDSAGLTLINHDAGVVLGYALGGEGVVSADLFAYLESLTA